MFFRPITNDIIKNREIHFRLSTPDQASNARKILGDVPGIECIQTATPGCLQIRYSVEKFTLQMIESALREAGFELVDNLVIRLKRAIFSYCEDALRASIGIVETSNWHTPRPATSHLPLQDPRPHDWRKFI